MLRQKQPMGIDIRMNKIMTEQKVLNPRYAVSWDFDNPQIVCAKHQLLDQRGFLAASQRLLRIPLIGRLPTHQRVCQDNSTEEPEDPNDLESGRARIFFHGTPLFSVP